jgi:hypothetical protein
LSFFKSSYPDVEEGEIWEANILKLVYPVKSQYKPQIIFHLESGDQKLRAYMNYYQHPDPQSDEAQLCTALMNITNKKYATASEFLTALEAYGRVYVKCVGFREKNDRKYPRFKIITDKLPTKPPTLQFPEDSKHDNPSTPSLSPEEAETLKERLKRFRDAGYDI